MRDKNNMLMSQYQSSNVVSKIRPNTDRPDIEIGTSVDMSAVSVL